MTEDGEKTWYIRKQASGQCQIIQITTDEAASPVQDDSTAVEQWGPFASQGEAIARRVGLIRAGKCLPA